MERSPYTTLGVGLDASQADIKQAFRERALECHPDRVAQGEKADAKSEFLRVQEAFDILSDPDKRAAYDAAQSPNSSSSDGGSAAPRTRSFKKEWRRRDAPIRVRRSVLKAVDGLWADQQIVSARTSAAVVTCAGIGLGVYVYDPHFIYGTGVYLIDLALCTVFGGAQGYVLGSLWGHVDVLWQRWSGSETV